MSSTDTSVALLSQRHQHLIYKGTVYEISTLAQVCLRVRMHLFVIRVLQSLNGVRVT